MIVSEWVLKGKKGKSKLHPYSMKLKEWTACSLAHKQLWCGYKSESKTGLPTVLSQNCLTLNLPTKNFPKETLISSTGLQAIKLLSLSSKPTLLYSALLSGTLQIFLLCQLSACQALPIGLSRERQAGKRDHCSLLAVKVKALHHGSWSGSSFQHFSNPTPSPNSLITFQRCNRHLARAFPGHPQRSESQLAGSFL